MRCCPRAPSSTRPRSTSDLPREVRLAELVREQVLLRTREELRTPSRSRSTSSSSARTGCSWSRAQVWAETESQKAILVGAGRADGQGDRHGGAPGDRALLGRRMHLELKCACARAGAATRACSTGSASSDRARPDPRVPAQQRGGGLRRGRADRARHGAAHAEPAARLAAERPAVEDPDAGWRELAEEAEQLQGDLTHRKLFVPDEQLGARLAPALARRGWNVIRLLVMVWRARAGPARASGRAAEVDRAAGAAALAAFRREQPFGWQREAIRQLAAMDDRYRRRLSARDFASPPDEPAALPALHGGRDRAGRPGRTLEAHRSRATRAPPCWRPRRRRAARDSTRSSCSPTRRTGPSTSTGGSASRSRGRVGVPQAAARRPSIITRDGLDPETALALRRAGLAHRRGAHARLHERGGARAHARDAARCGSGAARARSSGTRARPRATSSACAALRYDCDEDALLALVEPAGRPATRASAPASTAATWSRSPREALPALERTIAERRGRGRPATSYTARAARRPGAASARRCARRPRRSRAPRARSPTSGWPRRPPTCSTT